MKNKSIVALAIIAVMFAESCGQSSSTTSTTTTDSTDSTAVIADSVTVAMDSLAIAQ